MDSRLKRAGMTDDEKCRFQTNSSIKSHPALLLRLRRGSMPLYEKKSILACQFHSHCLGASSHPFRETKSLVR